MMNTHHIFGGQHFSSFLDVSISLSFYRYSCVSSWHVTSQHRQNSRFCATHRTNYFSLSECVKLGSIFFFFFHFYSKFSLLLGRVHSVVCVCIYVGLCQCVVTLAQQSVQRRSMSCEKFSV